MENRLRFTGSLPAINILADYPNWIFALDEEGIEGQDETTIKPEEQQSWISEETCFTVADVTLANGDIKTGVIRLEEGITPTGLDVFDNFDWWSTQQGRGEKWEAVNEIWLPESERRPSVRLDSGRIFPLVAKSRLQRSDGKALILSLESDGVTKLSWR